MKYCTLITIAIVACCLLFVGCVDSDTTEALSLGTDLKVVYKNWVKDGSPQSVDMNQYITSNRQQFFVYTNTIQVGTNFFHCRFGARSDNFRRKGTLVITDEQMMLWIGDQNKIIIVHPEKNRRFTH